MTSKFSRKGVISSLEKIAKVAKEAAKRLRKGTHVGSELNDIHFRVNELYEAYDEGNADAGER